MLIIIASLIQYSYVINSLCGWGGVELGKQWWAWQLRQLEWECQKWSGKGRTDVVAWAMQGKTRNYEEGAFACLLADGLSLPPSHCEHLRLFFAEKQLMLLPHRAQASQHRGPWLASGEREEERNKGKDWGTELISVSWQHQHIQDNVQNQVLQHRALIYNCRCAFCRNSNIIRTRTTCTSSDLKFYLQINHWTYLLRNRICCSCHVRKWYWICHTPRHYHRGWFCSVCVYLDQQHPRYNWKRGGKRS